ncbi:MAG: sugar kinase [Candidatus Latescibacterota bacterium]|nr:MAG: sugar kinase [Candidatus Latescibacterota bacterium]
MKHQPIQVFGLGQCCLDYLTTVDSYPLPDTKCEFSEMVIQGGGPVATAMVALSRWGVSTAVAGVIGDDGFGSMIKTSLDEEGVDTRGLLVRKGHGSQFAFIVAEPGAGSRTVFWRRPTGPPPQPDEIDYDILRTAEVLHTDGLFIDASLAAARAAREAGVRVVVDAGSLRDGMLDLARLSDCFIASEKFARQLVGTENPLGACEKMAELGPRVVAVTLGSKGYVARQDDVIIEKSAYSVDVVDTTGCGDVFHAGFTFGVVKRWDVSKSLDFGAWAAAMVSTRLGGRAGIPPRERYTSNGRS